MRHSRWYDFQGHPRSGSRSGDDLSPLSGLFFIHLPSPTSPFKSVRGLRSGGACSLIVRQCEASCMQQKSILSYLEPQNRVVTKIFGPMIKLPDFGNWVPVPTQQVLIWISRYPTGYGSGSFNPWMVCIAISSLDTTHLAHTDAPQLMLPPTTPYYPLSSHDINTTQRHRLATCERITTRNWMT